MGRRVSQEKTGMRLEGIFFLKISRGESRGFCTFFADFLPFPPSQAWEMIGSFTDYSGQFFLSIFTGGSCHGVASITEVSYQVFAVDLIWLSEGFTNI